MIDDIANDMEAVASRTRVARRFVSRSYCLM